MKKIKMKTNKKLKQQTKTKIKKFRKEKTKREHNMRVKWVELSCFSLKRSCAYMTHAGVIQDWLYFESHLTSWSSSH